MQIISFALDGNRTIYEAFYNYFSEPFVHYDRVMTQHDLIYILEGGWDIYQEDVRYTLQKDDVLILSSGIHHYGGLPCERGTKTMYIHAACMQDSFLYGDEAMVMQEHGDKVLLEAHLHCQHYPNIKRIFRSLAETFGMQMTHPEARRTALFQTLLIELYDVQCASAYAQQDDPVLREANNLIHRNPERFFTNKELADLVFVSPRTLTNRFSRYFGVTPYRYQMNSKLDTISSLLITSPDRKLHEIALMFGFYDEFHLSRCFKQRFGVSPQDYRKGNMQK